MRLKGMPGMPVSRKTFKIIREAFLGTSVAVCVRQWMDECPLEAFIERRKEWHG
jgi:hypothetical protein